MEIIVDTIIVLIPIYTIIFFSEDIVKFLKRKIK